MVSGVRALTPRHSVLYFARAQCTPVTGMAQNNRRHTCVRLYSA